MADYEFKYTASGSQPGVQAGSVDVSDLNKLTAIVDFTDADSGVRFFHDGNKTLYYVMLDTEQNVITGADGKAELKVAKDDLELNDGDTCSIFTEGATLLMSYPGHEREMLGSVFSLDNGDVKMSDTIANAAAADAPADERAEDAATEAESSEAAETEAEASSQAEETEAAKPVDAADVLGAASSEEEQNLIATAVQDAYGSDEDAVAAVESHTEVPVTPPAKQEGSNGVLVWAICATAAAVAAAAACALLAKKVGDSEKSRKLKETELKSLQRSVDDKTSAFTKGQDRIRELENQLSDANARIDELRDEAKTTAAAAASELERLESRPSEEALQEANARTEKLQQDYDTLYIKARTLMRENEQYAARIRELEQGAPSAAPASQKTEDVSADPAVSENEPDAFLICTSESELEKYADPAFVAPASSMTGEGTMLNKAPFRRASLVVVGKKAYLNPHFFRALSSGMESYSNLAGLSGVFEMEGLGSTAVKYRLSEIVPAQVSYDAATDAYHVDQRGKLVLRIG